MTATEDPTATDVHTLESGLVSVNLAQGNRLSLPAGRYWVMTSDEAAGDWPTVDTSTRFQRGEVVVPAPEGGLLSHLLAARKGLGEGEVVTLMAAVEDGLLAVPEPAVGRTRLEASCLALDADGRPFFLPGRSVPSRVPSAAPRLARLAYHAISGKRWDDAAVPLSHAASHASSEFRELLGELFDAEEGDEEQTPWDPDADGADDARRISMLVGPEPIGMRPSASTASPDEAPTGSLHRGSILAALLSEATHEDVGAAVPPRREDPPTAHEPPNVEALRRAPRVSRRAHARRSRRSVRRVPVAAALVLFVVLGGAWWLWPSSAPDPTQRTTAQTRGASPRAPAVIDGAQISNDPREALADLTALRGTLVLAGRASELTALTVPGSDAEAAEASLATQFPEGSIGGEFTVTVEDIDVVAGECTPRAVLGDQCTLSATSITSAYEDTRGSDTRTVPQARAELLFILAVTQEGWRVERVSARESGG